MISDITAAVVGFAGFYIFLWALLWLTQDAREPPMVETAIPFLSPIIVMLMKWTTVHEYLRDKYGYPIHTLRLPGTRAYVVNDTSLIPAIHKQLRTLTAAPFVVKAFSNLMGVSKEAFEIMGRDPIEDHGFVHRLTTESKNSLAPGPNLDQLNTEVVDILNNSFSAICAAQEPKTANLFEWASHEAMMATTGAIYGPLNPFNDAKVRTVYYDLQAGLLRLLMGFMKPIFAKKPLEALETITEAFEKYYARGGLETGSSAFARGRYSCPREHGVSEKDVAKMEAGGIFALIANTMPAAFWTLYHIVSDPVVLADCRRELHGAVSEKDGQAHLDLTYVKNSCPIMVSTMQEAMRFHSIDLAMRAVVEDHMLDGKYLLKKGATVMIPGKIQHTSSLAWGPNVNEFYHKRFLKMPGTRTHNPVAFRVFGGGATLCPGRHFVATEILAFASMMLLRFDIKAVNGQWSTGGYTQTNGGIRLPRQDVQVELLPRDNKQWHVAFAGSGKATDIAEGVKDSEESMTEK
ncbi:hypothetical protein PFICI_00141 [Pestalotiopsis fici W106-1]|uniref:Cytochrome P450 n=1 Tax=Pestalotiopsis fici (strain W106-1 / CGMCC3.15140) TaxID=1229662 RepID=W3XJV0_PESFW|nr:uncharacterized protein PFICI_00141 [Pestalotiopsis fici W106-1]ETS86313.1 hypothetical protein PFICI_00141 [Pestalotiopsis fici W106-1]